MVRRVRAFVCDKYLDYCGMSMDVVSVFFLIHFYFHFIYCTYLAEKGVYLTLFFR